MFLYKNMMNSLLSLKRSRNEDLEVENMLSEQENEQRGMKEKLMVGIWLKKLDLLDEDQDL